MKPRKITEGVHWLGAIDWDRRLFDSLIPLPDGTSYNAYLVEGSEKTVLIDTVDPAFTDTLMAQLEGVKKLDYVISLHSEQDHSGEIPTVLAKYPEANLICSPKAKGFLIDLLEIDESRITTVDDGETLSLGDRTLRFIHTPWVHWPETMVAFLEEDKILFSCDFFGSHIAESELYAVDKAQVYKAAKRYYAEIMMPFRRTIEKNLDKLKPLNIEIIAPSHGSVYDEPGFIVDAYRQWVAGPLSNTVVLPYISMHGSTQKMVDHLVEALIERGVNVRQFELVATDLGELAMSLVDATTIVIGTPTVLGGPHPKVAYATVLANAIRPRVQFASIIGSYSWGGKAVEILANMIPQLKVEVLDPVLTKGVPLAETKARLDKLADDIAAKHKAAGVL